MQAKKDAAIVHSKEIKSIYQGDGASEEIEKVSAALEMQKNDIYDLLEDYSQEIKLLKLSTLTRQARRELVAECIKSFEAFDFLFHQVKERMARLKLQAFGSNKQGFKRQTNTYGLLEDYDTLSPPSSTLEQPKAVTEPFWKQAQARKQVNVIQTC